MPSTTRRSIGTTTALAALLAAPPSASGFAPQSSAPFVPQHGRGIVVVGAPKETPNHGASIILHDAASSTETEEIATSSSALAAEPSPFSFSDLFPNQDLVDTKTDPDDVGIEQSTISSAPDQSVNDIVRDLDGLPLTKEYLASSMGIDPTKVTSYACPEKDAFRGFMSDACRVRLQPGGETAFYKRIVFEHLDHAQEKLRTAPFKLERDSKSYQVVASFLESKACKQMVQKTGVNIPRCYDARLMPNHDNPIESKFSFLLEDYSPSDGWYQQWLLDDTEVCESTLSTFAKIHAFFWNGSDFWNDIEAGKELEEGVWKSGSYVQPKAQPGQCEKVAREWTEKRMKFETEMSGLDYWDNLGERLESVAEECGRLVHPFAYDDELSEEYRKYRTFTHGDPKSANLFFRSAGDSSEEPLQVGLIDFQWSGFGLAASDMAHFMVSAIHADRLVDGGEGRLLKHYFDELQTYLVEFGAYSSAEDALEQYSYDTFMEQYERGILDKCRLVVAYTWSRFSEGVEKDDELGCARTMNKTSYNKSVPNAVWLMSRCDEILKSRGV